MTVYYDKIISMYGERRIGDLCLILSLLLRKQGYRNG